MVSALVKFELGGAVGGKSVVGQCLVVLGEQFFNELAGFEVEGCPQG